jgi:hypothetical protein
MSKTNGNGKKSAPYSYEAFVKNWTKANNVAEVVAATGLSRNTVSAMSTRLRKEGVKLKMMPRRVARPVDTSVLNKIIKDATA